MKYWLTLLKTHWEEKPLPLILIIAALARMISVIFAKGWGMLDDHFLVIEVSQSWADGGDVSAWLPGTPGNTGPSGHSFLYAGLHYLLFSFLNWIGLENPQTRMLIVRLLHAAFSMITVYLGYRIAEILSDRKTARLTGLLLALFWFMPWLGVRNLVEIVATPLLMIGTWIIMKDHKSGKLLTIFAWSGFIVGLAFSIRFQTMFYSGGIGLALLFRNQIKEAFVFGIGFFAAVVLIQGGIDAFVWGRPFAEMEEYVQYNMDNAYNYITGKWYNYLLLILGILIPPISLFLLFGFFIKWRKHLIIFLPTFIFLAFHSYFPNKQERFILTIVPFIIILGMAGWHSFYERSHFWKRFSWLNKSFWIFFWISNIILLLPVSTMYSKRARAEAMTWLRQYDQINAIILENTNGNKVDIVPQFYSGQWMDVYMITRCKPAHDLPVFSSTDYPEPKFVLFYRDENLENRVEKLKCYFPELEFETMIEPGFVDVLMTKLNPKNKNEAIYIFRNEKFFNLPDKPERH